MPAIPVDGAYTYRVYVCAHYADTGLPLYNTLYLYRETAPATEEMLDVAVSLLMGWLNEYYIETAAENVVFDPVQVRPVVKPMLVAYQGPDWRFPSGRGGEAAPRAMALNIGVAADDSYGRSQRNRIAQFGVPIAGVDATTDGQFTNDFVTSRILWLTRFRDDPDKYPLITGVYSPLTGRTYRARHYYEQPVAGNRPGRMHGAHRR